MSASRLLLDEMLSSKIAEQLRGRGHDAVAVTEQADLVSLPDEVLLAVAAAERRVLVTLNIGDFAALDAAWAAQGREHAGLVFLTTSAFPQNCGFVGAVVRALHIAVRDGRLPGRSEGRFLRQP
ncbi:MAG: hypothetical protein GEV08_04905 [Acidimicrobiia bacterium]|nr:hypothetical protein [Acidimicrobiia bacterium]